MNSWRAINRRRRGARDRELTISLFFSTRQPSNHRQHMHPIMNTPVFLGRFHGLVLRMTSLPVYVPNVSNVNDLPKLLDEPWSSIFNERSTPDGWVCDFAVNTKMISLFLADYLSPRHKDFRGELEKLVREAMDIAGETLGRELVDTGEQPSKLFSAESLAKRTREFNEFTSSFEISFGPAPSPPISELRPLH